MDLTVEEVEKYLLNIFCASEYVAIKDKVLLFKHPTNSIKQRAILIYEAAYKEAINSGMLPTSELETLIEKRNVITSEEVNRLSKLYSQLEAQEVVLAKATLVNAKQDRLKQIIRKLREDIFHIEFKKKSKLLLSADNKAEEAKTFYICSKCTYNEDGNLYWSTYEEAMKDSKIDIRNAIINSFVNFSSGYSNSIIRAIARSSLWRIRYINSMKTSERLFGIASSDYSTDQLSLTYWSSYYQNIYDMMPEDRPTDMVIEDDEALDAYMKQFYEERNKDAADRRSRANRPGKLSAFDAEEVIVTRSHELYQDIEYDTPKEAKKLKDRVDIKKKAKKG